jgi:DNA topoisomerase-1
MDHKLYLSDKGIYKSGNKFYFNKKPNNEVTDLKTLNRLSLFKVPPAWTSVWYASNPKCHIQVIGIDNSGKKQYILSDTWINNSRYEKFNRMKSFIKNLNSFKKKIKLNTTEINYDNLIKLLFNLLLDIHVRVGNEIYAKQNGSYGLTTLLQKHLKQKNGRYILHFVGKSNIEHFVDIPECYNCWFDKLRLVGSPRTPLFCYNKF